MTIPRVLDNLLTERLSDAVICLPSPSAVRLFLLQSPEVAEIRRALKAGELTETDIRCFVNQIMADFRKGERFCHEPALCAISVALERRETAFAEEYTTDLANLRLAELSTAIRVAIQSADARSNLAINERRDTILAKTAKRFVPTMSVRLAESNIRTEAKKLVLSRN